jgi:hypothetical protein
VVHHLALRTSSGPLASGTRVGGRFRVQSIAHRSGMSTVYRAEDMRNQGVQVALKEFNASTLPPDERDEALSWLAREAGLLSTLAHPRLPRLIAAFSEGDRHYVVMPFLQGGTLEELIQRKGPQPESLTLGWAYTLAQLLHYLHTQDPPVVHRDLKPANVLVGHDGTLTLLDLGVARPVGRGLIGTAVGTPGYAPPEQYHGVADERSDLYALGATLHRALTGYDVEHETPFRQPPVRALNPRVSAVTASLVGELLRVAPSCRPSSAHVVAAGIAATLRDDYLRPLMRMYQQMLLWLLLAVVAGYVIYQRTIGMLVVHVSDSAIPQPLRGDAGPGLSPGFSYVYLGQISALLRVLLVFAPALLCFLPLCGPRVRDLARRDATLRIYRSRAMWLLISLWFLPLAVWLADLSMTPLAGGSVLLAPGQILLSAPLAFGCAILAAALLLRQYGRLRRLRLGIPRLRWYHLLLRAGGLFLIWSGLLIIQEFAVHPW